MYYNQAFESSTKNHCGQGGRGQFGRHWGRHQFRDFWKRHAGGSSQAPVNLEETDSAYIIHLFAAGLQKEKVKLAVKDDVLTISYPGEEAASGRTYTYQEYNPGPFERSFQLNNKVLSDDISATYADGILTVRLPRNPATNQPAQTIQVA